MIAAFQRLELWPPTPAPEGIEEDDCCYEAPTCATRNTNENKGMPTRFEGSGG